MKKSCCLDRASLREMVQYTTFNSNLPDNRVSLAETTPDGTKWFLTGAGLVRLSGEETDFRLVGERRENQGCQAVPAPDGSKWLYDGRLIHLTASGSAEFAATPEAIRSMAVDLDGTLWVIGESGKVYSRVEDGTFNEYAALTPYINKEHRGRHREGFRGQRRKQVVCVVPGSLPA